MNPTNNYSTALFLMALSCVVGGGILWLVGLNPSEPLYEYQAPDAAAIQQAIGATLVGFGAVAFLVWMGARAVIAQLVHQQAQGADSAP
ncbi:hypothetical protein [Microcella sp.]|uniref:hypothetical protein n=1 Tax=Microcella sp. TaxID=1913979 RepID=UPI00391A68C0